MDLGNIMPIVQISIPALLAYIALRISIIDSKTSKALSLLTGLFGEYTETMGKINDALAESKDLEKFLLECKETNNFSGFNQVYYSSKYKNFRDVHYFFEMLGSILSQKGINKYTFWHFFSFPLEFFTETENIRRLIRQNNCLPSYGENFCGMFLYYNKQRIKHDIPWIINGKSIFYSTLEAKKLTGDYGIAAARDGVQTPQCIRPE